MAPFEEGSGLGLLGPKTGLPQRLRLAVKKRWLKQAGDLPRSPPPKINILAKSLC